MKTKGLALFSVLLIFTGLSLAAPPYEPGIVLETPVSTEDAVCQGYYQEQETEQGTVSFNWTVEDQFQIELNSYENVPPDTNVEDTLDSSNFEFDDYLACEVIVENNFGENSTLADTRVESAVPEVQEYEFHNYSDQHAFNTSALIMDREGTDVLEECRLEASNDTHTEVFDMDIDESVGDDTQAECFQSNISLNDFPVLQNLELNLTVEDHHGNLGNASDTNVVPNNPPEIFEVRPEDDSRTSGSDIELQANFFDRDGDEMNVTFYSEQASPEEICTETLFEGTVECEWEDLESMQDYQWTINVTDGFENVSETFEFRNIVASEVRAVTEFVHRYSSVVMPADGAKTVRYEVANNHDQSKELTSTVSGANAVFVREESNQISYSLPPDESEVFEIRLEPNSAGQDVLTVVTENENFDITNEDSMEVFARHPGTTTPEVPGIGFIHVMFLLMAATLFYYRRL